MPNYYFERIQRTLELAERYHLVGDGVKMLELGTGWMHWEALTTRLFFDIQADLYDVWDNRQLDALKSYLSQLQNKFDQLKVATPEKKNRAASLIAEIHKTPDFNSLYQRLGFRYILDPKGTLEGLASNSYDLVVSAGVFEHLPREIVPNYIQESYRILRPGGYAVHTINTTDHLHLYDPTASPKNYLRYSDRRWKLLFDNQLQYINRLQRCEWMSIFQTAGFTRIDEIISRCDISNLKIDKQYQNMDRVSLETTSWCAIYQKPATKSSFQ